MRKLAYSLILGIALAPVLQAQVTENFNHGNRNNSRSNCWQTWSTDVKTKNYGINSGADAPMLQTGALSGGNHTLISPFVDFDGTGTVDFQHKLSATNGTDRTLTVTLVDENGNVAQTLLTYVYKRGGNTPNGSVTSTQTESINVTWNGVYQIDWTWTGSGGSSRGVIDDVSISGTYAADPSQNKSGICPALQQSSDSDGDGVNDDVDQFPNDPNKVFVARNPSNGVGFSSIAFEDLWPNKGDYDFNDLVLYSKVNFYANANREITQIDGQWVVRAKGGTLIKGFGVSMPLVNPSDVGTINGQDLTTGNITTNANGTEAGQSGAVIIFSDNIENMINRAGGTFFNTISGEPEGTSDTLNFTVNFTNPITFTQLNSASIFAFKQRGEEIHKPDREPTDLADASIFGTGDDDSDPAQNRYYKTENNLPWALEISTEFDYPEEKQDIVDAYLNFANWAQTGGGSSRSWYTDEAGNRDASKIYQ